VKKVKLFLCNISNIVILLSYAVVQFPLLAQFTNQAIACDKPNIRNVTAIRCSCFFGQSLFKLIEMNIVLYKSLGTMLDFLQYNTNDIVRQSIERK
jgi:hypothetical protein